MVFEGEPIKKVIRTLLDGWYWHSCEIPVSWGLALNKLVQQGIIPANAVVQKGELKKWCTGVGPSFHYHYKLILKLDKQCKEFSNNIKTKTDIIFGSTPKHVSINGNTVELYACW